MKSPRTWNRREFNVAPNGFFTVLRDTGWFAAAPRLPGGFRYVFGKSKVAGSISGHSATATPASASTQAQPGPNSVVSHGSAMPWNFLQQDIPHRNLIRGALIVVVAAAITGALLWWINNPQ